MVKVKMCGITNFDDYKCAADAGADFVGFIFHEKSPRYIEPDCAREIISKFRANRLQKIGVFVNEKSERVKEIYNKLQLDFVQLHGDESPDYCTDLKLPYWKVIRVRDSSDISLLFYYPTPVFLLDTYIKDRYGGTGKSFDLKFAEVAIKTGVQIVIAGGLSDENINAAIGLNPFAVDINSGVEKYPGKKDCQKIRKIMEIIRNRRDVDVRKENAK